MVQNKLLPAECKIEISHGQGMSALVDGLHGRPPTLIIVAIAHVSHVYVTIAISTSTRVHGKGRGGTYKR